MRKPSKKRKSSCTLVDTALVSVLGVAKDNQDLNLEEASSTPGAKAKKTHSSEQSSSRNAKDKKTDTKDEGKAAKSMFYWLRLQNLQQQPDHQPKTDIRPRTTENSRADQVTSFASSTSPVDVWQTPETDMDTSSDSDSVVHEVPTGQAEEGELSHLDQTSL